MRCNSFIMLMLSAHSAFRDSRERKCTGRSLVWANPNANRLTSFAPLGNEITAQVNTHLRAAQTDPIRSEPIQSLSFRSVPIGSAPLTQSIASDTIRFDPIRYSLKSARLRLCTANATTESSPERFAWVAILSRAHSHKLLRLSSERFHSFEKGCLCH